MKIVTRNEMLEELRKDNDLHLYNGFYINGKEDTLHGQIQVLQGWAAKNTSEKNDIFYKIDGGFATEFVYKKLFYM